MFSLQVAIGRHYFEEANNVGGATNWSLIIWKSDTFRTSSYANFARWFLLAAER
jgi:hypothetical protein